MIAALLLLGQAVPPPPPAEEVVVTARPAPEDGWRIRPIKHADRYEKDVAGGLPRAAIKAFGGTLSANADQSELAPGMVSRRARITLTRPF